MEESAERQTPAFALWSWLEQQPADLKAGLVKCYILMCSPTSAEFVLNDEEALNLFYRQIMERDLPIRRIARLLTVRSIFSFLLRGNGTTGLINGLAVDTSDITTARFYRAQTEWDKLCANQLTDASLLQWLDCVERG